MFSDVLFIEHDFISVVAIAQLVEPRIVIPVVVGSSPIIHPTSSFCKLKNIVVGD